MPRAYIVTQGYENSNTDPIELKAGDTVRLGEKFTGNGLWPNWIYCVSEKTGKGGWTPAQILLANGESGVAAADYTAKELTAAAGDTVNGYDELNGWIWCVRTSDGQSGWIPKSCLKQAN